MALALIVAMTRSGVMGVNNKLPWSLPTDLKRFRQITSGHTVIMGRKTYESIGKPLPNRRNIVLSKNTLWGAAQGAKIEVFSDLGLALSQCSNEEKVFIIGGVSVMESALPMITVLHITWVDPEVPGDVRFPVENFDWSQFQIAQRSAHRENGFDLDFVDYHRLGDGPTHQ